MNGSQGIIIFMLFMNQGWIKWWSVVGGLSGGQWLDKIIILMLYMNQGWIKWWSVVGQDYYSYVIYESGVD